jgi:transketolase
MDIRPENWDSLQRDVFIQSKGHSVEALYVVLADLGFFDRGELKTGNRFQTRLIGHPTRKVPGVEHNTGGLGHGLSVSVGLALAAKLDGRNSRVFCLLGDGELSEGSNWEAAMSAAHYKLDNLTAVVDRNGLQITGATSQVNDLEPLVDKWTSFGWTVRRADGHDIRELVEALSDLPFTRGRPGVLLADTVKGRGISFIEGRVEWHHRVPSREQYEQAMRELEMLL